MNGISMNYPRAFSFIGLTFHCRKLFISANTQPYAIENVRAEFPIYSTPNCGYWRRSRTSSPSEWNIFAMSTLQSHDKMPAARIFAHLMNYSIGTMRWKRHLVSLTPKGNSLLLQTGVSYRFGFWANEMNVIAGFGVPIKPICFDGIWLYINYMTIISICWSEPESSRTWL